MKIKVVAGYSERSNSYYYRQFRVISRLPFIGESLLLDDEVVTSVLKINISSVQSNIDVFDYSYYVVETERLEDGNDGDEFVNSSLYYVCVKKEKNESEDIL